MKPTQQGYYRFPTIHNDQIAFVCEDDLWLITTTNPLARRLTTQNGEISYPFFSEDGSRIAYISTEEGSTEVYLLNIHGGLPAKLTELGAKTTIAGWQGERIIISTSWQKPFNGLSELYFLDPADGSLEKIPCGPARNIATSSHGTVIGRNTADPARWKRYRGGTAGELWIDRKQNGEFAKLLELAGNTACPFWLGARIYFISDHEQCGNLYSVNADGKEMQKHSFLTEFYVRQAASDGIRAVFQAGADLYLFDPAINSTTKLEIAYHSSYNQLKRKFVDAESYLEDYDLFADGSRMVYNIRGKIFAMGNWEGAAVQHGMRDGVRYRQTRWLPDGFTLITASDEGDEYYLELYDVQKQLPVKKYKMDIGIPQSLVVSPNGEMAALTNHRNELLLINLRTSELLKIEQNKFGEIEGVSWSPDSLWLAYAAKVSLANTVIKLYGITSKLSKAVTKAVLMDSSPCFDPDGRYLYFLSNRIFNPVYDNLHFDLNFPKGMKPYLILLQKNQFSPFDPEPHGFKEPEELEINPKTVKTKQKDLKEDEVPPIKIDLPGIEDRIVPFPILEGIYDNLLAAKDRIYYLAKPVNGALDREEGDEDESGSLRFFDLKELHEDLFIDGVEDFRISADLAAILYKSDGELRVLDITVDPKEPPKDEPTTERKEGWLNLERIKLAITPQPEWQQMFNEAWRLQRDYFWSDDMSGLDWLAVYNRYQPLLKRVASRTEFSDLVWELQGELGTSHAYEFGGDYREVPQYQSGFLGADFVYDEKYSAYRITKICKGDLWLQQSPLRAPGLNISEGFFLFSVGGQHLSKTVTPHRLLACLADEKVEIGIADKNFKNIRIETVRTLRSEQQLRYRDWVEANREWVHKSSKNKIGYLHVPDMDDKGYAEFHRYFLNEYDYDGLIVDVRYNGGGHVSQLLLEKLSRKRLGCDLNRWSIEQPYPAESAKGPIVVITNEHAGSDGDIFCHAFKMLKLGKLVGKRTWGGVVGIWPRNWLVDGTITTQPEFSFWFKDIGCKVENYGTEPDIEVEITPKDYQNGIDTQLNKALEILSAEIKTLPLWKAGCTKKERPKLGK